MNRFKIILCLNALLIGSASFAMDPDWDRELLHIAANMCVGNEWSLVRMKELLDKGVSVDIKDYYGWNLLIFPARDGNKEKCSFLLDCNAQIDGKTSKGETPLVFAARYGHKEVCRLLIERKAQVEVKTEEGETPLLCAAYWGDEEVCKLLIDAQIKQALTPVIPSALVLLGIKKFGKAACMAEIDSNVIRLIAHQLFDPEIAKLLAHVHEIKKKKMKEYVLNYALQKLKMEPKTAQGTSHE